MTVQSGGKVQRKLETARSILLDITKRPDCATITGYDKIAIESFVEGINAALSHYQREACRKQKKAKDRWR
jgi:hypothetical protein